MKRLFVTVLLLAALNITNSVIAETNVAIVDVQAVVASSAQVQALKKDQQNKIQELKKWMETAKANVDKQQTQEGKEKLLKKYDTEFLKKQQDIKENYAKKLQVIDKSITDTITNQAKAKGYDLVITKGVVIYGGTDITADVIKAVK